MENFGQINGTTWYDNIINVINDSDISTYEKNSKTKGLDKTVDAWTRQSLEDQTFGPLMYLLGSLNIMMTQH